MNMLTRAVEPSSTSVTTHHDIRDLGKEVALPILTTGHAKIQKKIGRGEGVYDSLEVFPIISAHPSL